MKTAGIALSELSTPKASRTGASSRVLDDLRTEDQASFRYFAKELAPSPKATLLMTMYLVAKRLENSASDIGVKNGSRIIADHVDSLLMDNEGQPKQRITSSYEKIQNEARSLFEMSIRALSAEKGFEFKKEKQQARFLLNLGKLLVDENLKPSINGLENIAELVRNKAKELAVDVADFDSSLSGQLLSLVKTDFGIEQAKPKIELKVIPDNVSEIDPALLDLDPVKEINMNFDKLYRSVQFLKTEDRFFNQDLFSAIKKISTEKNRLLESSKNGDDVATRESINSELSLGLRFLELVFSNSKNKELADKSTKNEINEIKFLSSLIANGDTDRSQRFMIAHVLEKQHERLNEIVKNIREPRIFTPAKNLQAQLGEKSKSFYDSKNLPTEKDKSLITKLIKEVDDLLVAYRDFNVKFPPIASKS